MNVVPSICTGRRGAARTKLPSAAVLASVLLFTGCAGGPGESLRTPLNILLIVSDTFRADAIDCEDEPEATPNLCALAARGVRFDTAYSHAPDTPRSSVAMFTGNHARIYTRTEDSPTYGHDWLHVPEQEQLLAECLSTAGYDTPAFLQNRLAAAINAMQGFRLDDADDPRQVDVAALEERLGIDLSSWRVRHMIGALAYLLDPPERFYLVQWILDPHAPYDPPDEYVEALPVDRDRLPRPLDYYRRLGHFDRPERGFAKLQDELPGLSPYERRLVYQLYLKEVEWVDRRVGYLLDALAEGGAHETTVVVFTADHGEGFGEHGQYLHGTNLYDEMVRVPLLAAGPGVPRGRSIDAPVSLVDLTPTLADLIGSDCPGETRGESLVPLFDHDGRPGGRPVHLANPGRQPSDALIVGNHKLIVDTRTRSFLLFDLLSDPAESHNLAGDEPELVQRMALRLAEIRAADQARRTEVVASGRAQAVEETREETLRQLEALGYLD